MCIHIVSPMCTAEHFMPSSFLASEIFIMFSLYKVLCFLSVWPFYKKNCYLAWLCQMDKIFNLCSGFVCVVMSSYAINVLQIELKWFY